jgi:phosphatidylinositol alpha 1,6-mannosyltransferase
MRKIRVLIVSDSFLPRWDGVSRFLNEIIPALGREMEVTVVAPKFGRMHKFPGVKYYRFKTLPIQVGDINFCAPNYFTIKNIVRKNDIIFSQTIGPLGSSAIIAASKLEKPIVHYVHSIDWELAAKSIKRGRAITYKVAKRYTRYVYSKCTTLLVPARTIERTLNRAKIKTNTVLCPLGVNTKVFEPSTPSNSKPKSKSLPIIGFVGRVAREKDLITLYRAFRRVKKEIPCQLVIVGAGLLHEIPKGKNVSVVGPKNNVVPYLQKMDVFALPSLTETSSLATMEAMSTGTPVVVTRVGNIPEYIKHEENGFLFNPRDYKTLAKYIKKLLTQKQLAETIGRRGRETIIKRFSWKVTVDTVVKTLRSSRF